MTKYLVKWERLQVVITVHKMKPEEFSKYNVHIIFYYYILRK